MARRIEKVSGSSSLYDVAGAKNYGAVRHLTHDSQVVGDEEHGGPELRAYVAQHSQHLGLDGNVECSNRFVAD